MLLTHSRRGLRICTTTQRKEDRVDPLATVRPSFTFASYVLDSEALKDHEAVPFYSALDYSRSADETNLALAQSMENSQEGLVDEPPKSLPKPAAPPAVLTWDDTLDRKNLLGSNSGFFSASSRVL